MARILGVAPASLAKLEREGLPTTTRRKKKFYPIAKCVRWYVDYRIRTSTRKMPPRAHKQEIAQLLGVTTRQVTNLVEQGMPAIVEDNLRTFPLPDAVHWYLRFKDGNKKADALNDLDRAKLRKLELEAAQQELTLLRLRGESLDRRTVENLFADLLQTVRGELLNFAARWAAEFLGAPTALEMRRRVKRAVHETIATLGKAVAAVGERLHVVDDRRDGPADDDAPATELAGADNP